jgi:hypothetical protein
MTARDEAIIQCEEVIYHEEFIELWESVYGKD